MLIPSDDQLQDVQSVCVPINIISSSQQNNAYPAIVSPHTPNGGTDPQQISVSEVFVTPSTSTMTTTTMELPNNVQMLINIPMRSDQQPPPRLTVSGDHRGPPPINEQHFITTREYPPPQVLQSDMNMLNYSTNES